MAPAVLNLTCGLFVNTWKPRSMLLPQVARRAEMRPMQTNRVGHFRGFMLKSKWKTIRMETDKTPRIYLELAFVTISPPLPHLVINETLKWI